MSKDLIIVILVVALAVTIWKGRKKKETSSTPISESDAIAKMLEEEGF